MISFLYFDSTKLLEKYNKLLIVFIIWGVKCNLQSQNLINLESPIELHSGSHKAESI